MGRCNCFAAEASTGVRFRSEGGKKCFGVVADVMPTPTLGSNYLEADPCVVYW